MLKPDVPRFHDLPLHGVTATTVVGNCCSCKSDAQLWTVDGKGHRIRYQEKVVKRADFHN